MEPITFIVTALAAGAAAGLTGTAEGAVKEAYAGIKTLIQRKFGGVDLAVLESKPESATRRAVVAEELTKADAAQDQALLQAAEQLMQLIQQRAPQVGQVIGVDLNKIKGGSLDLSNISASGQGDVTGLRVNDAEIQGDLKISGVQASGGGASNTQINTDGGSVIQGSVDTGGGDFVGRDKHVGRNPNA
ncbi:MAG: hypothetical protein H6641_16040 [Caldilineaceae bacterium]|nr:hypothetical protein [Caldilineaceae bacterium]